MSYRSTLFSFITLFAYTLFPYKTSASVVVAWDWNNGTTEGWATSGTVANIGNRLEVGNAGNGSLQIFSPDLSDVNLRGLSTISFDLSINSYSTVASPADLTFARLELNTLAPMGAPPGPLRFWNLDLSNLAFGQTKTFNVSIQNASGFGSLANVGFIGLLFADDRFTFNTSSASLDNFVVLDAVPEPATILLLGIGAASFCALHCRRK